MNEGYDIPIKTKVDLQDSLLQARYTRHKGSGKMGQKCNSRRHGDMKDLREGGRSYF